MSNIYYLFSDKITLCILGRIYCLLSIGRMGLMGHIIEVIGIMDGFELDIAGFCV